MLRQFRLRHISPPRWPSATSLSLIAAALLAIGYFTLVAWFHRTDFYEQHFFDHGSAVTTYQQARLLFTAYFAWLIYVVGFYTLRVADSTFPSGFSLCERYALGYLTGVGVAHVVLFCAGSFGLYTASIAIALTAFVMILSLPHLSTCLLELWRRVASVALKEWPFERTTLAASACLTAGAFLLVKGLYPAGGHDYYNHYFPFYKAVVSSGGLAPNEVWYQYFYSKGAGLYFLAMLLTDPLAPQLVTTSFVFVGSLIVFTFLRTATSRPILGGIGAVLYLLLLIYSPGPLPNQQQGGWGDMEKLHELTAVLALGAVWCVSQVLRHNTTTRWVWYVALYGCLAGAALLTFQVAILLAGFLGIGALYVSVQRKWRLAVALCFGALFAGLCVVAVLAVNFVHTSLLFDQLIPYSWPWADLNTLRQWGALFAVLTAHWAHTGLIERVVPWSWGQLPDIATYLRLELWWPVLLMPTVVTGWPFARQDRVAPRLQAEWAAVLCFLAAVVIAALVGGARKQPISFYRISSFSYAPCLCLGMLWCARCTAGRSLRFCRNATVAYVCLLVGLYCVLRTPAISGATLAGRFQYTEASIKNILINATHLWRGRFSLRDAYQNQQGWPGRMPWGGIYPGLEEPWRIVQRDTPIWSLHVHSYCMLPRCNIQTAQSFRFVRDWPSVFFGSPDDAERALRSDGINFFFFSQELSLRDPLPASPLFSPTNIGRHLGVRWTDGVSYLLTWRGADTKPLDERFLQSYSEAVRTSGAFQSFKRYSDQWKRVADYLRKHPDDSQPFALPWCVTCEGLERLPDEP